MCGVHRGECSFEVDHSDVAGVDVGLAAFSPSGVRKSRGAATFEAVRLIGSECVVGQSENSSNLEFWTR